MTIIFSIFESLNKSDEIITELLQSGIPSYKISIITKEAYDNEHDSTINREVEGAPSVNMPGLLAEVIPVKFDEIGNILITGQIGTILNIDSPDKQSIKSKLLTAGLNETQIATLVDYIRRDYTILAVNSEPEFIDKAQRIFDSHGGIETTKLEVTL